MSIPLSVYVRRSSLSSSSSTSSAVGGCCGAEQILWIVTAPSGVSYSLWQIQQNKDKLGQ